MKIHRIEQRSPEWFDLRKNMIITASEAGPFLYGTTKTAVKARENHIFKRLSEPLYDDETLMGHEFLAKKLEKDSKSMEYNPAVQRGNALEPMAREKYAELIDFDGKLIEVGMIEDEDHKAGASPDGLIMDMEEIVGGVEIKCPFPETHQRYLYDGVLPASYEHQVHTSLAISGAPWWDFFSYCPGLPPFYIRVYPSDVTASIKDGLKTLHSDYKRIAAKLGKLYDESFEGKW